MSEKSPAGSVTVCEIYDVEQIDGSIDKRMRIVNCINLIDVGKKIKSPMQTPDQIEYLKKVILDYNGGADAYGNILGIYIDAGSGGGGVNIADYLMPDWTDKGGIVHRGLIDKEYSSEYVKKFPNAVDKVHLMSPSQYKSEMYEAMIELMNQDKISFTTPYDNKGYLTIFDVDESKLEKARKEISEKLKKEKLNQKEFEEKYKYNVPNRNGWLIAGMETELGKIANAHYEIVEICIKIFVKRIHGERRSGRATNDV